MKKVMTILLHIGYWVTYVALLLLFFLIITLQKPSEISFHNLPRWTTLMFCTAIVPGVTGFYTAYTFVFAIYRKHRKFVFLLGSLTGIAIIGALAGTALVSWLISPRFWTADGYWGGITVLAILAGITLINAIIGLIIKGFLSWYQEVQIKEMLAKRNYEMELALIKSQIDPHFLFNTIHTIDILIEKDSAKASAYLNKLSDMMRFMLYETKTDKIPLSKELMYIEKYIDFQKIRTPNPERIRFSVDGDISSWVVEPMLFIPFIENAFKHSPRTHKDCIEIDIQTDDDTLKFHCQNSIGLNSTLKAEQGGLGKELIEKRLELLYGKRHTLTTVKEAHYYRIHLTIHK